MKLYDYCGKKLRISLSDGNIIEGKCIEYTKAIENDPEIDSIDVKVKKEIYEIYENEIEKIEIL